MAENNDYFYVPLSARSGSDSDSNSSLNQDKYVPLKDRPKDSIKERELVKNTDPKTSNVSSSEVSQVAPSKETVQTIVQFDVQSIDDDIVGHGIPTIWQQAFICPCIDPVTFAADPLCPICHGTYRGYLPGRKDTYVALQSQNRGTANTKDLGNLDLGTAKGTFRGGTHINVLDRITIPGLYVRQNFAFTVTQERFDSGFYIPYDIHKIIYGISYKDREMHDLIENYDYVYNKDERKFHIRNKQLIGATISLILSVTVRYIITDIIRDTRYQYDTASKLTQQLPKLALLKRESVLINNVPLVPKSPEDIDADHQRNQALSEEGLRIIKNEKRSGFGLGDI